MDNCDKGSILGKCAKGEELELENVLYIPELHVNILSLGQLDEHGRYMKLRGRFMVIPDHHGRLLTKVHWSFGQLYQVKLNKVKSFFYQEQI